MQGEKLASANELKSNKFAVRSLRDELEKGKFDKAEAVQAEKLASMSEIKALKATVAALRNQLEKNNFKK